MEFLISVERSHKRYKWTKLLHRGKQSRHISWRLFCVLMYRTELLVAVMPIVLAVIGKKLLIHSLEGRIYK